MADFDKAFPKIASFEGYYVSQEWERAHGDQHSGETYMGVDRIANPTWTGWAIIDKYKAQHGTPAWNFRFPQELGLEDLVKQYAKTQYWDVIHGDDIQNQDVAEMVLENKWGGYTGIKGIQTALNSVIAPDSVRVDGGIGSDTLAKINSAPPDKFLNAMYNDRLNWIQTVGQRINAGATTGWTNRLNSFKNGWGQNIVAVEQAISTAATKTIDTIKNNPIILVAGIGLIGFSLFMAYKYFSPSQMAQITT